MNNDASVQKTNDFSTVSKGSAAERGYYIDQYQSLFTRRPCRRAPLIHRGYCVRWWAVTRCLREFLEDTAACAQRQVVSLGCGFDSLYFRMRDELMMEAGGVAIYEVDFPAVVERKRRVIEATPTLRDLLSGEVTAGDAGGVALLSQDYKLLGVDLSDVIRLDSALEAAGIDWEVPTLLLAEVALCYMEAAQSSAVIGWAGRAFSHSRFVLYEQFSPGDPFGRVMIGHFASLSSALRSVGEYPHLEDQERRFLQQGWQSCKVLDMNQFSLLCVAEAEAERVQSLEPFDEFEELHLKCSHYFILAASRGLLTDPPALRPLHPQPSGFWVSPAPVWGGSLPVTALPAHAPRRFGHRSCLIADSAILTTGGFGEADGKHQRLCNLHLMWREGSAWRGETITGQWDGRLLHSLTPLADGKLLVLGGRFSPSHPAPGALILECDPAERTVTSTAAPEPSLTPELQRWRHSATLVTLSGKSYIFVFGGRSVTSEALEDSLFLQPDDLRQIEVPVMGGAPRRCHSHASCRWRGGAVISGGLLPSGVPSGSVHILEPQETHFRWKVLDTHPALTPRYAHTSHVIGDKLLLIGGVWIHCRGVPGLTVIDLRSGHIREFQLNTESLEWPLMLHNHSSILLPGSRHLMLLGGGGTCFSFGTHLNPQPVMLEVPVLKWEQDHYRNDPDHRLE